MIRIHFEQQYKAAAAEGAIVELRLRMLADKVPELQKLAHDKRLEDVEAAVVKHFADALTDNEAQTLLLCRQMRNKILHCDFRAARDRLEKLGAAPLRGEVKKIDIAGMSGAEIAEKMTKAFAGADGAYEYVADTPAGPGGVFGWLIELGQAGDFTQGSRGIHLRGNYNRQACYVVIDVLSRGLVASVSLRMSRRVPNTDMVDGGGPKLLLAIDRRRHGLSPCSNLWGNSWLKPWL